MSCRYLSSTVTSVEGKYRFLLTGRWLAILLLGIAVMVTCVLLGSWQWSRHEERAARNAVIENNYDAAPLPLAEVIPGGKVGAEAEWHPVELRGHYIGNQLTLRNRPVTGTTASRTLAIFRTTDGIDVVVDRGWVPGTNQVPPDYPPGEVELLGRLRQAEAVDDRVAPAGQVYAIAPAEVIAAAGLTPQRPVDGYVMAASESPPPAQPLQPFPKPETTPGSHLSYAVQWWLFALGGPIGYVLLARREAAEHRPAHPAIRRAPKRPRRGYDAEEEDAVIDAQLAAQANATNSR